jgi:DNA-directed RNA polymerase subunit beta'
VEIYVESRRCQEEAVPLSKHILVQDNDFIRAGMPLPDGAINAFRHPEHSGPRCCAGVPRERFSIPLAGVKINDKHIEVVVRQMMRQCRFWMPVTRRSSKTR